MGLSLRVLSVVTFGVALAFTELDTVSAQTIPSTQPFHLDQPNAYAVVIGIGQYREEVIPKITYAVRDAEDIAQVLETQAGLPKANIKLLTDTKATIGDFRNHFGDWLRIRVKSDSTVYVYYAGHGTPNPKTGEAYLVPWDGHPDFPSGLYPLDELYETLNKLSVKNVVVLLDSCFSGSPGRSVLAKGARPMVLSVENPLLAVGNATVLSSSSGTQISSDYDKGKHGLFTYYLLLGLKGSADADQDGIVTLEELYPYVRDRVKKTALEQLNREQTPVLLSAGTDGRIQKVALAAAVPLWERALRARLQLFFRMSVEGKSTEEVGLKGPVHTVSLHWDDPTNTFHTTTYDRKGHLIESVSAGIGDFTLGSRVVYVYDLQGRLVEMSHYRGNKDLKDRKEVFNHDMMIRNLGAGGTWIKKGDRIEEIQSDGTRWIIDDTDGIEVTSYTAEGKISYHARLDSSGKKIEEGSYFTNGEPSVQRRYDSHGMMIEFVMYGEKGIVVSREQKTYNSQGDEIEQSHLFRGELVERQVCTYQEFDSYGNWIKRINSRWGKRDGHMKKVDSVELRTITYY